LGTLTGATGLKDVNLLGLTPEQIGGIINADQAERELRRKTFDSILSAMHPTGGGYELKKVVGPDGKVTWKSIHKGTGTVLPTGAGAEPQLGHKPDLITTAGGEYAYADPSSGRVHTLGYPSSPENRKIASDLALATKNVADTALSSGQRAGEAAIINKSEAHYVAVHEFEEGIVYDTDKWHVIDLPPVIDRNTGKRITARYISEKVGRGGTKTIEDVLRLLEKELGISILGE